MRPILFVFALFSCSLPIVLKAADPLELVVRVGYENAMKEQQESNRRIDRELGRLSKVLDLAENRSMIDRKLDLTDQNVSGIRRDPSILLESNLGNGGNADFSFENEYLVFVRSKDRKEFIEKTKEVIDEVASKRDSLPKWLIPDFVLEGERMNQAGRLSFEVLIVVQNLGDGSFLGRFELSNEDADVPIMLVTGMPGAKEFSDDHKIYRLDKELLVACCRTHQYESVGKSIRTVHVLEILDPKRVESYVEAHVPKEDREPRVKPKPKRQKERVWTDKTGKLAFRATLKSIVDESVTLVKPDGTETVLRIDTLSNKDQKWLEAQKEQ